MHGNTPHWSHFTGPAYETWYVTLNDPATGCAFWIRGTLLRTPRNPNGIEAGVWFTMFDPRQPGKPLTCRKDFPADQVRIEDHPFDLRIGPATYTHSIWTGQLAESGYDLKWDLTLAPTPNELWLIPSWLRRTRLPKSDLCIPHVNTVVAGTIEVNGETFRLSNAPAGQAHHWGRHYARHWLWGHGNAFEEDPRIAVEALSVKLFEIRGQSLPITFLYAKTPLGTFQTNRVSSLLASSARYRGGRWIFTLLDNGMKIEAQFTSPHSQIVTLPYISPHGEGYECHNGCLCDAILTVSKRAGLGWERAGQWHSYRQAAAEFCTGRKTSSERFTF